MRFRKKRLGVIAFVLTLAIAIGLFSGLPLVAYGLTYVEGDTWIGTDGQVMSQAHASQWQYVLTSDGTGVVLNNGSTLNPYGYSGSYTADGQIMGSVPASINGKPVVSLASTFKGRTSLKIAPELPNTVTDMSFTFSGCTALTTVVNVPSSTVNMEETFKGCSKLVNVPVLPDTVMNMKNTFAQCVALQTIQNLPANITEMYYTFSGCSSLKSIPELPENLVNMIGTFASCTSLTTVEIPASVTSMERAFWGCTSLITLEIPSGVTNLESTFRNCTSLTGDIVIPNDTTILTDLFRSTSKPITMKYSQYNPVAITYIAPSNVTKQMVIAEDTSAESDWVGANGNYMSLNETKVWKKVTQVLTGQTYYGVEYIGPIINGRIVGQIPAYIEGKIVNLGQKAGGSDALFNGAFQGNTQLVHAPTIPDNTEYIDRMFYGDTSLTGEIFIPDSISRMTDTFTGTAQPITMFYNTSNTVAANAPVPSNVAKVGIASQQDYESSQPIESEPLDESVSVSLSTTNGSYSVEVGETLQFQATVNRDDLQYRWVVQDLFDTNGQDGHFATIDSTGKVSGVQAGYAIVGLMVKFEDGSEYAYGLTLVEVTSGGQTGYSGDNNYTIPGSYVGGWNYSYGYSGSLGSWFDATTGGLTVDGSVGGGGTGGTGGTDGSGGVGGGGTAPYPSESNAVTKQDNQTYEPSTSGSGSLFDKSKNYLKVGDLTEIEVINLNPDNIKYKLVSKSLASTPSVIINQAGQAVGNYRGVSLILLLDEENKIIDTMLMYVGNTDSIDTAGQEELNNASDNPSDYGFLTEISNNPPNTSSIELIGLVEPITTLNVVVPLTINFTIDTDRRFIASDVKIVSNCPAPLRVSINNVEKGSNAPDLVSENNFTEKEWNNLSKQQASNHIALSLNGKSLAAIGGEVGTLKSGFREPVELNLKLTGKYGKAWNNTSNFDFNYSLVLLVEMQ